MELVENSKALNYLVPKLINKTEDLQKELKTRMKSYFIMIIMRSMLT